MSGASFKVSVLVLLGAIGCDSCQRTPKNAKQMKMPTGTPNRPQGMKALTVTAGAQPFSKDDVAAFVHTHRLGRMGGDLAQLQVESLEFITAGEATTRLQNASPGIPVGDRVGFAIIRGPISFTGPQASKPVAFERCYALFDAGTGNLLMSGTLDGPGKPSDGNKPQ